MILFIEEGKQEVTVGKGVRILVSVHFLMLSFEFD